MRVTLTFVEKECLETLTLVREAFAAGHNVKHITYQEVMGRVGQTIKHLENKEFGCASGRHASACGCQE